MYDRVKYLLGHILKNLDKLLFNEKCLGCKKSGFLLCRDCINSIPRPEHDLPEYIYALYEYRHPIIKKILTDAKYRKKWSGLKTFGPYLASSLLDIVSEYIELNNYTNILIIPVPISNKRFKNRGFNQAKIIAESIVENINKEDRAKYKLVDNIIKKVKDKTPQASIHSKKERLNSPKGTFEIINPDMLAGSLCIIIDDITTTGGTINEMRRMLLASGVQDAFGLTIAH